MRYVIYATKDVFNRERLMDEIRGYLLNRKHSKDFSIELRVEENLTDCTTIVTGRGKGEHQFKGFIHV